MPTIRACLWFAFFAQLQAQHDSTQRRYRGQVSTRGSCSKRPAPAGRTSREPGVGRAQCTQCTQCAQCGSEIDRCSLLPRFSPALLQVSQGCSPCSLLPSRHCSCWASSLPPPPPYRQHTRCRSDAQRHSAARAPQHAARAVLDHLTEQRRDGLETTSTGAREPTATACSACRCRCSSDHVTTSLCLLAVL